MPNEKFTAIPQQVHNVQQQQILQKVVQQIYNRSNRRFSVFRYCKTWHNTGRQLALPRPTTASLRQSYTPMHVGFYRGGSAVAR